MNVAVKRTVRLTSISPLCTRRPAQNPADRSSAETIPNEARLLRILRRSTFNFIPLRPVVSPPINCSHRSSRLFSTPDEDFRSARGPSRVFEENRPHRPQTLLHWRADYLPR